MKIAGGIKENGIVVGNAFDKYGSKNPIVNWIMKGFCQTLSTLVIKSNPKSIHEIGCGEGFWVLDWLEKGIDARGSDFSEKVIQLAQMNAQIRENSPSAFTCRSIYDLNPRQDSADLIVCCEVLEHLEFPEAGLASLQLVTKNKIIISVPQDPIWCMLNLLRGKYLTRLGNTPGHIQHWSSKKIVQLVGKYFF